MKLYILILFNLISICIHAQVEPIVVVSPNHNNVLYVGLEYTFDFYITDVKPEEVTVTANTVMVRQNEGIKYKVVLTEGSMREFSIIINIKGKHIKTIGYHVGLLPSPTAYIGNKSGGLFTTKYLLSNPKIAFKLPAEYEKLSLTYTLEKYEVTFIPRDSINEHPGYYMCTKSDGKLTDQILQIISKLMSGDLVTIFNIEALGPDKIGMVKIQEPISITIE
ncbi:MAG: hypothetical protein HYZ42_07510 [Bacteroidetes bacterium]|nr:hypothetical protein [Bacteroidota bacterium]